MFRRLWFVITLCLAVFASSAASAAVTITFWSHEQDESFPHAFFALKGTPDAGGAEIDDNYGFTAKAVTPAILFGNVAGTVEVNKPGYMRRSDARFSVVLTDAQLADIQALIAAWKVNTRYNLNKRNCVHFVGEAARLSGLTVPPLPKLMKKPRSFLLAVAAANEGRITVLNLPGKTYFAQFGEPGSETRNGPPAPMPGEGVKVPRAAEATAAEPR